MYFILTYSREIRIFLTGIILFIAIGNLIFRLKQILRKDLFISRSKNNNKIILKRKLLRITYLQHHYLKQSNNKNNNKQWMLKMILINNNKLL